MHNLPLGVLGFHWSGYGCRGCPCPVYRPGHGPGYTVSAVTGHGVAVNLCIPTKTGYVFWEDLLRKHQMRRQQLRKPCFDNTTVKIYHDLLLVRNPYERLLSSYLDQVVRTTVDSVHMRGLALGYYVRGASGAYHLKWNASVESFQTFVREMTALGPNRSLGWS